MAPTAAYDRIVRENETRGQLAHGDGYWIITLEKFIRLINPRNEQFYLYINQLINNQLSASIIT